MKKLLAIPLLTFTLVACGDNLPSECDTLLKELDNATAKFEKEADNIPADMRKKIRAKIKQERKDLLKELKSLSKDDAIKACKNIRTL